MYKIISPNSFDFGVEQIQLAKMLSSGKFDRDWMMKRASIDLNMLIKDASFDRRRYEPVHVITVGDMETFGLNRNGDGFPRCPACREYHTTFEKFAYVFRNHRNKPDDEKYGIIIKSLYNEKMGRIEVIAGFDNEKCAVEIDKIARGETVPVSMACTSDPYAPVITDKGLRPISEIKVGDSVLTNGGHFKSVTEVFKRPYVGYIYIIKLEKGLRLELTPEHPLYATLKESPTVKNWVHVSHLKPGDILYSPGENPIRILSIAIKQVTDVKVYNLEVKTDHSYYLSNVLSHNCRVPFDVCSYCGNKAPNRLKYCSHLKYDMTKIASNGVQIGAINLHPYFKDLSIVTFPADRIAGTNKLIKAASDKNAFLSGAALAEMYGLFDESLDMKYATVIDKLAEMQKKVIGIAKKINIQPEEAPEDEKTIDEIRQESHGNLRPVIGIMIKKRIVLTPKLFGKLITGKSIDVPTSSLTSMLEDTPMIDVDELQPSMDIRPPELEKAVEKLVPRYSVEPEKVSRRTIVMIKKKGQPAIVLEKSSFAHDEFLKIYKSYIVKTAQSFIIEGREDHLPGLISNMLKGAD